MAAALRANEAERAMGSQFTGVNGEMK